jgi:RNA polymerase sigma-70 factor (ECF subfamily)
MDTVMKNIASPKNAIGEEELVALLAGGDREVIGTLYDMYAGALFGVIVRIVRSEQIAEDLLQETFIRVWKNRASYNSTKGRLFTWLINIARNIALDQVKSRAYRDSQKNQDIDNLVSQEGSGPNESYNPEQIGVKELLGKLSPEQHEIVDLIYFQGYTHSEAADQLGIPLGTVKTRLRAAISYFRSILS